MGMRLIMDRVKFIIPLINKDGSFEEIERSEKHPYYIRLMIPPGIRDCFIINSEYEVNIMKEEYELKTIAFAIDQKRCAQVSYYVSTEFMRHIIEKHRSLVIEDFAKQNAPWLFTYGERIITDQRGEYSI